MPAERSVDRDGGGVMQLDMEEFVKDVAAAVGIPARYMRIGQPWGYPSWVQMCRFRVTTRDRKRERRRNRRVSRNIVRVGPWREIMQSYLRKARNG